MKPLTVLLIGSLYPPDEKDFLIPGLGGSNPEATQAAKQRAAERFKDATKAYNEKQKPQFEAACEALGAAFARNNWRIMVGVPIWEQWSGRQTVAPFVLAGANSVKPNETTGPHPIVFYAPHEPEVPTQDGPAKTLQQLKASHPNVKIEYKLVPHGQYKAKVIPNIASVDAVVLVAGKDGTATIGYAAYSLERPVLAVAGFGGAARDVLDDVLFDVYDRYKDSVNLTDEELLSLTAAWNGKSDDEANGATAENVVSAAEKLVKGYALAERKTTRVLKWAMLGMALLLVLWVAIFLRGAALALETPEATAIQFVPVAFFLLLYISAAVGTGLRVLVAFESNQLTRLTGLAVGIELVVALSVAFGLALFYLIGSISFTGEVSMLASNAQKFPMVAVSMSLLGLAAGYLVPLDKLRDRLQKIFAEEKK